MNNDEVTTASLRRVSADTERADTAKYEGVQFRNISRPSAWIVRTLRGWSCIRKEYDSLLSLYIPQG